MRLAVHILIVALIVAPSLYIAAYLALLKPQYLEMSSGMTYYHRSVAFRTERPFETDRCHILFRPLISLDHHIRPSYWGGIK